MKLDVEFRNPFQSERRKQKRTRLHVGHRDADVSGRQRAVPVRRLVIVGVVLVRAAGIRVVVSVTLVNQAGILKQRVRRRRQLKGYQQHRDDASHDFHERIIATAT